MTKYKNILFVGKETARLIFQGFGLLFLGLLWLVVNKNQELLTSNYNFHIKGGLGEFVKCV